MNLDLWRKLPEQQKTIVESAVQSMEERRFQVAEAEEQRNLKKLQGQGIDVIHFSKEEIKTISKRVRKNVWPLLRSDTGVNLLELLETSTP